MEITHLGGHLAAIHRSIHFGCRRMFGFGTSVTAGASPRSCRRVGAKTHMMRVRNGQRTPPGVSAGRAGRFSWRNKHTRSRTKLRRGGKRSIPSIISRSGWCWPATRSRSTNKWRTVYYIYIAPYPRVMEEKTNAYRYYNGGSRLRLLSSIYVVILYACPYSGMTVT